MVPIGLVTRDRVEYLDVTLKSLSATKLPAGVSVTVFDDGSMGNTTKNYYSTNKVLPVAAKWPTGDTWKKTLGLHVVNQAAQRVQGIKGKVSVVRLGKRSSGVVNASCRSICRLFEAHPDAPGVFLLQDDIVFKEDWYDRMLDTVARASEFTDNKIGLLAGIKLNYSVDKSKRSQLAIASGVTAQCLYISRAAHDLLYSSYLNKTHTIGKRFDDTLRRNVAGSGLWAGCIFPFVCQHIGVKSLVRPKKPWKQGRNGRVGYYAHPPYAMAGEVRQL